MNSSLIDALDVRLLPSYTVETAAESKCKDPGFIAGGGGVREGEVLDDEL